MGGKVIDTVSAGGKVIALAADIPSSSYSFIQKVAVTRGLVRYVEPTLMFKAQFTPNDPYFVYQWGPRKIEANLAWDVTTGNSSLLVAVIDTGIDYHHPDLVGNYVSLGYDWVHNSTGPLDDNGHGTHVAGIIAATLNNAIGIAGVAQVRIMAEKALNATGWGEDVDLAKAMIHAVDEGAKILSNSWGSDSDSFLIHDAVQYAYEHDVLVVAAAGNEDSNAPFYPAAYPEVVSVAATDGLDYPAVFSNWGDWIEVSAPGVYVYSTMPTYPVSLNSEGYSMNYDYLSGTSMACPHVSAVAALIWSRFPNASRNWVREQLRQSADDLGPAGFDVYYGYGRINAYKAVSEAPAEHDVVLYGCDRPRSIQPGDTVAFNVTVLNFGLSNENSVLVDLIVDGVTTDHSVIGSLPSGSLSNVTLRWRPQEEGVYNVTFYAQPVPGETVTGNNVVSAMISVHFLITLNPSSGPVGALLNVSGTDFTPSNIVAVTFNDLYIGCATTDSSGNFTFTFNVPVSVAGTQVVKAYDAYVIGKANFTVVEVTPLGLQLDCGTVHFSGEIVTFYAQTTFKGQPVDATITETLLYKPDGTTGTVPLQQVATGLYKGSYSLPSEAEAGSYALTVTATYETDSIISNGASFKSFLVSPTLSGWNALLVGLNGTVGTIRTDLGLLQVQFDEINASLASFSGNVVTLNSTLGTIQTDLHTIKLEVTAINGTTATIQTVLGTVNGTVTSINDQTATIMVPRMGQVQADISGLKQTSADWTILQYVIVAVAATAAVSAVVSVAMLKRRKTAGLKQGIQGPSS
jgi:subtilisin family serine protease